MAREIKCKKAAGCIASGINKFFADIDDDDMKEAIEKVEKAVEDEKSISQTYVLSTILNEYRYTARRTDITEEEKIKRLRRLKDQLALEADKFDKLDI